MHPQDEGILKKQCDCTIQHVALFLATPQPRSEHTIEENILKKSDQKRHLDFLANQVGVYKL